MTPLTYTCRICRTENTKHLTGDYEQAWLDTRDYWPSLKPSVCNCCYKSYKDRKSVPQPKPKELIETNPKWYSKNAQ